MAYIFGSIWDRFNRNALNDLSKSVEQQGLSIQDLVAKGQLTPTQYATLIQSVNGLISRGEVGLNDLSPGILEMINEGSGTPFEILSIPRNGSVDEQKTTFIETSTNLIDKNSLLKKHAITNLDNGIPKPNSSNHVTDFISVQPGEQITVSTSSGHRLIHYDLVKDYVSDFYIESDPATFTIPSGVFKVRTNVNISREDNPQINRGNKLLPYTEYEQPKLKGIGIDSLPPKIVKSNNIDKHQINANHTDFIETSTNLINEKRLLKDHTLSNNSQGKTVSSNSQNVTDYISVIPEESYTISTGESHRVSYYNKDKVWLYDEYWEGEDPVTFIPRDDAAYIRTNVHILRISDPQLNAGNKLLEYEEYYYRLSSKFDDEEKDDNIAVTNIVEPQISYSAVTMENVSPSSENNISAYSIQDFYDIYDDLVERHPDYVTLYDSRLDDFGNPINAYKFSASNVPTEENDIPIIFINTGTHGYERVPIWVVAQMFKKICDEWQTDSVLEKMRWNMSFIVIPVVNPWALLNNSRKTHNGVDLLRNYPLSWDIGNTNPDHSAYRGPEALSEIEAQFVYDVFESVEKWDYVVDYHNFFSNPNEDYMIWVGATAGRTLKLGQKHIREMSGQLKKDFEWTPKNNNSFGFADMNNTGIYYYANKSRGINSSLYETIQTIAHEPNGEAKNSAVMKLGIDAFVNWLYLMYLNR